MILGAAQYILPEEPNFVYAVIMHHPLDWFLDKAEAKQYLHNRVRILMHGHEHMQAFQKSVDGLGQERLEIYAGATNPPESGGLYRHSYNWIELELRRSISGVASLAVRVFPRVWVPEHTRFAADIQRLAGSDSTEFELVCPTLASKRAPRSTEASAAAPAVDAAIEPSRVTSGAIAMDDESRMAKLKFLFWRYLDWQQRLKVLVNADALPSTVDRPVPHTMEMLALENAREKGKLAEVWDAMMAFIPADKQQANPFEKAK